MNYNNTQTPLSAMTQPIRDPQIILTIVFGVAGSVLALIAMIIAYLQLQKHKHTMNSVDAERNNMSLETIHTQPQEATSTDQEQRESINTHVPDNEVNSAQPGELNATQPNEVEKYQDVH